MFGLLKDRDKPKKSAEAIHADLEAQAARIAAEIAPQQPAWLARYVEEHAADCAAYAFSCERRGNFLTMHMQRGIVKQRNVLGEYAVTEESTTVNLSNCREIKLVAGHVPDMLGEHRFTFGGAAVNGYGGFGGTGDGQYDPGPNYYWKVSAPDAYVPERRPLFALDSTAQTNGAWGYWYGNPGSYTIQTIAKSIARLAEDDTIRFEGVNATLFCPATKGAAVRDKILAALA